MSTLIGILAVIFSLTNNFDLSRWVLGHLFVFIFSGWSTSKVLLPKTSLLERIVTSSLFSLLLTYPSSVLVTLIEGQSGQAIFSRHLHLSISVLFIVSQILPIILSRFIKPPKLKSHLSRHHTSPALLIALVIYSLFVFTNLNRADLNGDEYDLGYQSYNLVDGIFAGRKAYVVSFSGHPPLSSTVKHFSLNLLEPSGLDHLQDWHFRISEGLLGLLVIVSAYLLAQHLFSQKVANLTAIFLATNNYLVWLGRIYHREMLLTLTMTLSFYFATKIKKSSIYTVLTGVALGTALLTKETALLLIPVIFLATNFSNFKKILATSIILFFPVVAYNLLAYAITGHADVFFSNLFGKTRPGATPRDSLNIFYNLQSITSYLFDILSPGILFTFLASFIVAAVSYFRQIISAKSGVSRKTSLIAWVVSTVAFFSITAIRGYYFLFIVIPLTIISAAIILQIKHRQLRNIAILLLLIYSSLFSFRSNINRKDTISLRPTYTDGAIIVPNSIFQTKSQVTIGWTFNNGYKELTSLLEDQVKSSDCLILDPELNTLSVRRYFWTNDGIKKHYLGQYRNRFPLCTSKNTKQTTDQALYVTNNPNLGLDLIATSNDPQNNPRFYVYQLY